MKGYIIIFSVMLFMATVSLHTSLTDFEKQDFKKSGSFLCEIISGDMKCEPILLPDNHVSEVNLNSQHCDHYDLVYGTCS